MAQQEPGWERDVLEKVAMAGVREQRSARRWSILFRLFWVGYAVVLLAMFADFDAPEGEGGSEHKHTALVSIEGVISPKENASADRVMAGLQHAFKDKHTAGVVLRINSPGGSPVQSALIYDEILRLRAKYPKIPLHVVVEDICASGGYFVAAAADRIHVNRASLVGSIGVLMDGFGFTGTMDKLGIERRLLTAGENKGFLDPFSPQRPEQQAFARELLKGIHNQFIDAVRKGRGKSLKETPEMFSGLIWTGEQAVSMGLADTYGSVDSVARDLFKAEKVIDFTRSENPLERVARKFGAGAAEGMSRLGGPGVNLR